VTTGDRRSDSYVYNVNEIKRKKGNSKKPSNNNNVMIARKAIQGNSKAHSLSVLKRKAPDMFQAEKLYGSKMNPHKTTMEG
jgi:hypothetical protein